MTIQFEPCLPENYQAVCDLVTNEEDAFLFWPKGEYPVTPEHLKQLAQERTDLTIARDSDGNIIGFANFYDHEEGKLAFLGNVIVAPNSRGKGVGEQLVKHMIKQGFETLGLQSLRLSVFSYNEPALKLYRKLGFIPYDIDPHGHYSRKKVALLHMELGRDNTDYQ